MIVVPKELLISNETFLIFLGIEMMQNCQALDCKKATVMTSCPATCQANSEGMLLIFELQLDVNKFYSHHFKHQYFF